MIWTLHNYHTYSTFTTELANQPNIVFPADHIPLWLWNKKTSDYVFKIFKLFHLLKERKEMTKKTPKKKEKEKSQPTHTKIW